MARELKSYRAVGVVSIHAGLLGLTDEQAAVRAQKVEAVPRRKGVYSIKVAPVHFKVGEVFGYDGDVVKSQAEFMVPAEDEESPKGNGNGGPRRGARKREE